VFRYVYIDATYCKARVNHRVVSQAVVVATGVTADGRREVLGFDVGDSEDGAFWTAFLRSLKTRGLDGVQLVISDAHSGLKAAIAAVFVGAGRQRCRVHFLRNVLALVPKGHWRDGGRRGPDDLRPTRPRLRDQLDTIAGMLGRQFPKVETQLTAAKVDITAFADFPVSHWKKIWSTNPLERVNKRSNAAPTWSASSRTRPPCSASPAPYSSRPTTNGKSPNAATSPKDPWPPSTPPPTPQRR